MIMSDLLVCEYPATKEKDWQKPFL